MNKTELIAKVAEAAGLTKKDATAAVGANVLMVAGTVETVSLSARTFNSKTIAEEIRAL